VRTCCNSIDLPNDDDATRLLEAALKALAARFNDASVKVDETVFNAARITKAYGTVVRKGDDVAERPHRLSRIVDAPDHVEPVPRELLAELARAENPTADSAKGLQDEPSDLRSSRFDISTFLARHLSAREPVAHEGGRKWVLESCPFDADHKAPDAAVFERADGSLAFKCFHNSCAGYGWRDVREKFEPRVERSKAAPSGKPQAAGRPEPPKLLTMSAGAKIDQ
jgi:hypothetical protein